MNRNRRLSWNLLLGLLIAGLVLLCGQWRLGQSAAAATGAPSPVAGSHCSVNADCGTGICVGDVCMQGTRECTTDSQCGGGGICSYDGYCYGPAR